MAVRNDHVSPDSGSMTNDQKSGGGDRPAAPAGSVVEVRRLLVAA